MVGGGDSVVFCAALAGEVVGDYVVHGFEVVVAIFR